MCGKPITKLKFNDRDRKPCKLVIQVFLDKFFFLASFLDKLSLVSVREPFKNEQVFFDKPPRSKTGTLVVNGKEVCKERILKE